MSSVARGLDDAGVEMIEVSHGDGLGGSTVTYGFSKQSEMELIQAASEVIKKGKLAVLLLPGIGTKDDLKMAEDYGAKVAQIATHVTEADVAEQHIGLAKSMGMEVIGMLMLSHMASPEKIAEQGKLMESFGADVVLVTDSAGALLPETVRQRVGALRAALKIGVGFHGHNNLVPRGRATASLPSKRARAGSMPAPAAWARVRGIHRPKCSPQCWTRWVMRPASICGRSWMWRKTSCGRSCPSRCASAK